MAHTRGSSTDSNEEGPDELIDLPRNEISPTKIKKIKLLTRSRVDKSTKEGVDENMIDLITYFAIEIKLRYIS